MGRESPVLRGDVGTRHRQVGHRREVHPHTQGAHPGGVHLRCPAYARHRPAAHRPGRRQRI